MLDKFAIFEKCYITLRQFKQALVSLITPYVNCSNTILKVGKFWFSSNLKFSKFTKIYKIWWIFRVKVFFYKIVMYEIRKSVDFSLHANCINSTSKFRKFFLSNLCYKFWKFVISKMLWLYNLWPFHYGIFLNSGNVFLTKNNYYRV